IEKLGRSMDIRISDTYHQLRLRELELTADHLNKVAQEKEREREEKARLREERQAQAELDREQARLEKERRHYENALAALRDQGDEEGVKRLQEQIDDVGAPWRTSPNGRPTSGRAMCTSSRTWVPSGNRWSRSV